MPVKKGRVCKQDAQVRIHQGGVLTVAPHIYIPKPPEGFKRGKVSEWSPKSRMRLRRFLLEHESVKPCHEVNVTLTVPGPVTTTEEKKLLWHTYSRKMTNAGVSIVWRLEVQKRGAAHWHCLFYVPKRSDGMDVHFVHWEINHLWLKSLRKLGPCAGEYQGAMITVESRDKWPFADKYAVHVDVGMNEQGGKRWAWRRYMQDHVSKGKQEQLAVGFGRHWGVVGRDGFRKSVPDEVLNLSDRQFWAFLRWSQRLISGTIRCDKAPFGRKRGKRFMRGSKGKSVYFSEPKTMERLARHALSIH